MASESGGKRRAQFSSMKLPPLTKQLKRILSEYPDGGQIIKELLQNADDAGATHLELLCDERPHQYDTTPENTDDYNRFFEGPSLCVYNDAVFAPKDWEGIKMLDSSVKEDDRMKVGRFGQGFKSVFHLTDYPCVLSGDTLLLIDPQQPQDKVNAMMELGLLYEYDGIDMDAFYNAFEDMFGLTKDVVENGTFPGTIFRFPLRRTPSELSSNMYSTQRLLDLFDIFDSDASSILLFLRSLDRVTLQVRDINGVIKLLTEVNVANIIKVKEQRDNFNQKIKELPKDYGGSSCDCCLNLSIEYTGTSRGVHKETCLWVVVNYFMGGKATEEFKQLIIDPELNLCPYVGVAAPVNLAEAKLDGHVYCFLPLPREGAKLTGLPVHVNGHFALNQSRHHLKWATDEQQGSNYKFEDKTVLWNQMMIKEALPQAYTLWFQHAIKHTKNSGNNESAVAQIHGAFPDDTLVHPNWSSLLEPLINDLENEPILFTLTKRWVCVRDAYLIIEDAMDGSAYKDTVIEMAKLLDIDCVVVNRSCYDALTNNTDLHASPFTPTVLSDKLQVSDLLTTRNDTDKLHILEYLLSEDDSTILESLPLLPLASKEWVKFMTNGAHNQKKMKMIKSPSTMLDDVIFMATTDQMPMFPGMEDIFIRRSQDLPVDVQDKLAEICESGEFQISKLEPGNLESLLTILMETTFPGSARKTLTKQHGLTVDWLTDVWRYLLEHGKTSLCQTIPIFPCLEQGGNWDSEGIPLICLTKNELIKCDDLTEGTVRCFKSLGINVITEIPPWIPTDDVQSFVLQQPSPKTVSEVLVKIKGPAHREKSMIQAFNKCGEPDRLALMQYMSGLRECTLGARKFLRELQMFPCRSSYNGKLSLASVSQTGHFTSCENFPVRYPLSCLDGYDKSRIELLTELGCQEVLLGDMFKRTFEELKTTYHADEDVTLVMNNFVSQFKHLQYTTEDNFLDLVRMAKEIPFLISKDGMKKPSDLFNPSNATLQELLLGQDNMFPLFTDDPHDETISILTELGLKEECDVTAQDVLDVARLLDKWCTNTDKSEQDVRRKAHALINHLASFPRLIEVECDGSKLQTILEKLNVIEYETKRPENYPPWMPWFSQEVILCKPTEAKSSSFQFLVGAEMPTVASTSDKIATAFEWDDAPELAFITQQLMKVSNHYQEDGSSEILVVIGRLYEWFCNCKEDISDLENKCVVWNGRGFSKPSEMIIEETEGDVDLSPYFCFVPDTLKKYTVFFESIGCHSKQAIQILIEILKRMTDRISDSSENDALQMIEERAIQIVKRLAQRKQEIPCESVAEICIPLRMDVSGAIIFKPLSECTHVENNIGYIGEHENNIVHFVDHVCALKLGLKTKRRRMVGKISKGIPFGQKEELVTRLRGLLNAYPRDDSVLKELLQNADDAGATELHFIKDYRTHSPDPDLISDTFFGPALCVFNNSYFTENDLDGIHKLGHGSKNLDPAQTGQYGVGFNSVYHLTDTPSFMSMGQSLENGGVVCIFDPTCNNIVDVDKEEPGMRYDMNIFREEFSQALLSFSEQEMFKSGVGTMFRFPLRKMCSEISDEVISQQKLDAMLETLVDDLKEVLLFLKHIKCIQISDVTSGEIKTTYRVSCTMSDEDGDKKSKFNQDVQDWAKQAKEPASKLPSIQSKVQYVETVEDSKGFKKNWLIIQQLGTTTTYPEPIINSLQTGKLCQLPVGGVAVPIIDFREVATAFRECEDKDATKDAERMRKIEEDTRAITRVKSATVAPGCETEQKSTDRETGKPFTANRTSQTCKEATDKYQKDIYSKQTSFEGKVFAVLPLPVTTGLPVHINGHFALDHESRRDIWKEGVRLQWNEFLRKHVIVPCFVEAISYFTQYFIEETAQHVTLTSQRQLNLLMNLYHHLFPVDAKEEFWRVLVRDFYEHVYTVESPIFPVTGVRESSYCVSQWVPLVSSTRKFSAVFNTIRLSDKRDTYRLERVLKDLGMQLVQTPSRIFDTITKTIKDKKDIRRSWPNFVMNFLRTFQENETGACVIGEIDGDISETMFKNPSNLEAVVSYISKDEEFFTKVVGLPVMLTADGILHMCTTENPVYTSAYADLVPKSASKFLHKDLRGSMRDEKLMDKDNGILKSLDIVTLLGMLPDNVPELKSDSIIPWDKDNNTPISQKWLFRLFKFVSSKSIKKSPLVPYMSTFKEELFCENIGKFKGWAILSSTSRAVSGGLLFQLVPADKAISVFQPDCGSEKLVDKVLDQMNIPVLDKDVYLDKVDTQVLNAVTNCITTTRRPDKVLKCLIFHRELPIADTVSTGEALDFLNYFERNLDALKLKGGDLRRNLTMLPLFVTTYCSILGAVDWSKVLVLDGYIPSDGLHAWSLSTRILILRYSEKVGNLYDYLGFQRIDCLSVYIDMFSKDIEILSLQHLLIQMAFIRDNLLHPQSNGKLDFRQKRLVELLKQTPFISVNGQPKRANELFDGKLPLFRCMVSHTKFLPKEFRSDKWTKRFLPLLDFADKGTETHILQFAGDIEAAGKHCMNDELLTKSELVLERLLQLCKHYHNPNANPSDTISKSTLMSLKNIRFIFPKQLKSQITEIAGPYDERSRLIAFNDSVMPDMELFCWTSMNILPDNAVPVACDMSKRHSISGDGVLAILGVHNEPPLKCVIQHCENISKPRGVNCLSFDCVLDHVYEFLLCRLNNSADKVLIQTRLKNVPLLFIPEACVMVKCSAVAVNMNQEDVIKPYLYKAPQRFGKYPELFETLGAYNQVTCNCVISVLGQLKQDVGVAEMTEQDLKIAAAAMEKLLSIITAGNSGEITLQELYLPDESKRLRKAADIVVCDNENIMKRIQNANLGLVFFIGFQELKIEINNAAARRKLGLLPESMQPRFLMDIIAEEVLADDLTVVDNCQFAVRIEEFVHSADFLEGLLRILQTKNSNMSEQFEQKLLLKLRNVKIRRADNIKTVCCFGGDVVFESEQKKLCFIQEDANTDDEEAIYTMYFQPDTEEDILDVILAKDGLIMLIELLCDNYGIDVRQLANILRKLAHPGDIKSILDKEGIPSYHLPRVYPKPGTVIAERFHSFLEHDIRPFDRQEYMCVALEVEDESDENDSDDDKKPVFVYVSIVEEVRVHSDTDKTDTDGADTDVCLKYRVDNGTSKHIVVPIYRLYRFKQPRENHTSGMVKSDIKPERSHNFDENCRDIEKRLKRAWTLPALDRKHVVRRLMFEWHPDKNQDDTDYCTRVFQFIMTLIERLEASHDATDGRETSHENFSYHRMGENMGKRASAHARDFHSNYDSYREFYFTGQSRAPRPDVGEAKRWLRQARNDFRAAEKRFPEMGEVDGYNWICYMCHQACEKALKAGIYTIDANSYQLRTHSLTGAASCLDNQELSNKASQLQGRLGNHTRMRYPDSVGGSQIPSEAYDSDDARFALTLVKEVLDIVDTLVV